MPDANQSWDEATFTWEEAQVPWDPQEQRVLMIQVRAEQRIIPVYPDVSR